MNPFVTFLIVVPLIVSGTLTIAAAILLIEEGPKWDFIAAFLVLLAISGSLVLLFKRTSRSSLVDFSGSERIEDSVRRSLTTFTLIILYSVLIAIGFALFSIDSLRNWLGALCMILGLLMCFSSAVQLWHKSVPQLSQSREIITKQIKVLEISLSSYTLTRSVLLVSLILMGISLVTLYKFLGWNYYLSLLDLTGFLFLGLSTWLWYTANGIARRKTLEIFRQQLEMATPNVASP